MRKHDLFSSLAPRVVLCSPFVRDDVATKVSPDEDSDEEARADAKAFIQSVKAFTGIGEDDPEEVSLCLHRHGATIDRALPLAYTCYRNV